MYPAHIHVVVSYAAKTSVLIVQRSCRYAGGGSTSSGEQDPSDKHSAAHFHRRSSVSQRLLRLCSRGSRACPRSVPARAVPGQALDGAGGEKIRDEL